MSFEKWEAVKDPDGVDDYGFDWAAWLGDETISNSIWLIPAAVSNELDSHDNTTTTIRVSGGVSGSSYQLTNRVTSSGGRSEDRTGVLKVKER